ncbi:hypothetical protein G6011_05614 [Alternaria panax]|uniref:Uncharacterized protein n=1 Tax=Alternaria panax TaxID=48097 RepID=A0AAD4FF29_9PLEO|nr:hypothetical protein G6011_05614 [Alternaria panax]
MDLPASLARDISPPLPSKGRGKPTRDTAQEPPGSKTAALVDAMPTFPTNISTLAAVEAGI